MSEYLTYPEDVNLETAPLADPEEARKYFANNGGDLNYISAWSGASGKVIAFRCRKAGPFCSFCGERKSNCSCVSSSLKRFLNPLLGAERTSEVDNT